MGNCLVLGEKETINMKKMDGMILNYQTPLKVHQELPKFLSGHLNPIDDKQTGHQAGVVRVKLVISKQELKEILGKEGLTIEDMMSQIQKEKKTSRESEKMWRPALESIPEVLDLY